VWRLVQLAFVVAPVAILLLCGTRLFPIRIYLRLFMFHLVVWYSYRLAQIMS
jgi:hypothetical protein